MQQFQFVLPEGTKGDLNNDSIKLRDLQYSSRSGWGKPVSATIPGLIEAYDAGKSLGIRCTITSDHLVQVSSARAERLFLFFDNPKYGDVLFAVHEDEGNKRYILACKDFLVSASQHFKTLFDSGFSETSTEKKFKVKRVTSEARDFTASSARIREELQPFLNASSEDSSLRGSQSPERPAKKRRTSDEEELSEIDISRHSSSRKSQPVLEVEESDDGRPYLCIDIRENDFDTYRAFVAFLHTETIPFLPIPSNFLVALENEDQEDSTAFVNDPVEWLKKDYDEVHAKINWKAVMPCCPRSTYRLADCYGIQDLKDLSLGFIVRSLTVENVAYELFSPLSLTYDAVKKEILEFFLKNWKEVKETKGFKKVLEKHGKGELSAGTELIGTIFSSI
ncbi:hypothetical protein JCM3765_003795 [Sporobolomyces pararoseus]